MATVNQQTRMTEMSDCQHLKTRQAAAKAALFEGAKKEFMRTGSCAPVMATAPDTGKDYVIFDLELIPMHEANQIIGDAADAASEANK